MQAIVVNAARELEVCEVSTPDRAPDDHLLLQIDAAAINHGDKTFLKTPSATRGLNTSKDGIWGASAAGRVLAAGNEVPSVYTGRKVAVYRSLTESTETVGLWSERAVVPVNSCILLSEEIQAVDYSGSLVNMITAHAFLETITAEGHAGVIATVGGSATGLALAALARRKGIPVVSLVRSAQSAESARSQGYSHVLDTGDVAFDEEFEYITQELKATAVFDGAGGGIITRIVSRLPHDSTVFFYGFLSGAEPVAVATALYMARNITLKPFSNFRSTTVRNPRKLRIALEYLQTCVGDPLFHTKVGATFSLEQIHDAMMYEAKLGERAVLLPASS